MTLGELHKNKKKLILIICIVIALIVLVVYFLKHNKNNKDQITLYGNIEIRTVDLGFRVEGIIKKLYFEEGDSIKRGDLVATLEDTNYVADYQRSVAEAERAASISRNAASKYQRNYPLCADDTVSKQDCDDLLNAKNESSAALNSAAAQVKAAKKNLNDTRIFAPEDGIITTRVQEEGASVMPTQPVYIMAKNTPVWIRAFVKETDLGNIEYGGKARIITDTIDPKTGKRREYDGYIGYISPIAEFTPKTVQTTDIRTDLVYRLRIYIYEVDTLLRQGMPTTIIVDLKNKDKNNNKTLRE